MTKMENIRKMSDKDLAELVQEGREKVRQERFKDAGSRKAGVIRNTKTEVARALSELSARRNKVDSK